MINYRIATFIKTVMQAAQLPVDVGGEIAFIGRSNAGKSSTLNTLTEQKSLARVSKTPGRTQAINLFGLSEAHRLVDLPGYGFAKVPPKIQAHWAALVERYLTERKCLKGLVVIMDVRRPLMALDEQLLGWAVSGGLSIHVVLSKADKLKAGAARATLQRVEKMLAVYEADISVQLFSSLKRQGVAELRQRLDELFLAEG